MQVKQEQARKPSMLDFFPGIPRPIQVQALQQIEENWDKADVFVVNLPVGAGKSRVAVTISRWANAIRKLGSSITTPTNVLVDQYRTDFPKLPSLSKKDSYTCSFATAEHHISCKDTHAKRGKHCANCPYVKGIRQAHAVPYGVYNNHIYLAHKIYRAIFIADEAHNLVRVLQDRAAKIFWHHDYGFPQWVRDYGSLLRWVEANPYMDDDPRLQLLYSELVSGKTRYVFTRTTDLYRGEERDCIKMSPVDVRDQPPIFWPAGQVRKVILLSATIGQKDVEQLGLDKKRVYTVNATSPVDAERRPVVILSTCSMAYAKQQENLPVLAKAIRNLLKDHEEKGLIHITYSLASMLRPLLADEPRLRWHNRTNARDVYTAFKEEPASTGAVLVASGMYEGIDLPYDAARWQVITKVPYPSLAEPAVRHLADKDPEWYAWETSKAILQASGRVVRASDDWGITYIIDSTFEHRLYRDHSYLFPQWWKESLVFV